MHPLCSSALCFNGLLANRGLFGVHCLLGAFQLLYLEHKCPDVGILLLTVRILALDNFLQFCYLATVFLRARGRLRSGNWGNSESGTRALGMPVFPRWSPGPSLDLERPPGLGKGPGLQSIRAGLLS